MEEKLRNGACLAVAITDSRSIVDYRAKWNGFVYLIVGDAAGRCAGAEHSER
jgi:hypothetical protein